MKHGLFIRDYDGMYAVELSTPSVGMTLYTSTDRAAAEAELFRQQMQQVQRDYETQNAGSLDDDTPIICGYYGRACRNRDNVSPRWSMKCLSCPLYKQHQAITNL